MASVRPVELELDDAGIARRSLAERSKLRRELGRLDAVCLLIAAFTLAELVPLAAVLASAALLVRLGRRNGRS